MPLLSADNLADLKALVAFMRESGATFVAVGNVEVELGPAPSAPTVPRTEPSKPDDKPVPVRDPDRCACGHSLATEHSDDGCLAGGCDVNVCLSDAPPSEPK